MEQIWRCSGFRAVRCEGPEAAAWIFAERRARRELGRSGVVVNLTLDQRTGDRAAWNYTAFVAVPTPPQRASAGRQIWLHLTRAS